MFALPWGRRALPLNRPAASGGLQQAFRCCEGRLVSGAVCLLVAHLWAVWVVRGTPPRPQSVRFSELALRAVGLEGGRPPGSRRVSLRGISEVWRFPPPRLPGHRACCQGSVTHLLWGWMCAHGGPALSLWLLACPAGGCVPPWWWRAVPWGVAFHRCEGHLVSGAVPLLAARQGPVARVSQARVVWAWGPRSARSCEPALRAVGEAGGHPRGGALRRCEGRLRSGARPPPAAQPQGGP